MARGLEISYPKLLLGERERESESGEERQRERGKRAKEGGIVEAETSLGHRLPCTTVPLRKMIHAFMASSRNLLIDACFRYGCTTEGPESPATKNMREGGG